MQFNIQRLDNSAYIQIQLNAYICTQSLSSRKTLVFHLPTLHPPITKDN